MKVAIVGGGITGLTTALSLHAAGVSCVVFEAVAQPAPLGVGINLLPHAMRELTELGLLPELRAAGVEIDELAYLTKHGKPIWREPRGLAACYDWPQIAIHRGELQMLLLRAVQTRLGPDAVRFGHALSDLELTQDGVVAHFRDRSGAAAGSHRAEVLAAADGIHSAVRRKFYPDEGLPKWNGVSLYRSTSRVGKVLGGRSMLWAGHARQKFVAYPIRYDPETGETLLNWICDLKTADADPKTPPKEDWNRTGERADLEPRYQGWNWPGVDVPELVASSGEIFVFPMVDRDPLPRWAHGRATLLGDAAHPMYPIGSNGATQGIIDARAFAYHVATAPDPDEALARYEADRRPATERIVLMNRANGPDQVMELAEQRAPNRDDDLDAALPMAERQAIADDYKRIAGFDPSTLNARRSYMVKAG
ncbi:flavin-dependent oxidoreductase [Phenylobacterium sp. LjRoot219]|uniref:flavin-dependent oxidoreductase n=1 Tax=Phenylobacterium sp. LjRoot219 TaxID=3342283 RepID=UPI003ECEFA0D